MNILDTPVAVLSNGTDSETAYLPPEGEIYFADGEQTTTGAGGLDPQDAPKLVGEKTGVVEATYGDVEIGEFEEEMRGREGLVLFHKMLTDSTIAQVLNYQDALLMNNDWLVPPASTDPEDLEIAAHVADQLGLNDMKAGKYSFHRLLRLYRMARIYRQSYAELCFAPGPDGKVVMDKLIPMHPFTIDKIEYDNKGGPKNIVQKGKLRGEGGKQIEKKIPIWKTVVFTNGDDGVGSGESVLRPAVLHWRIKRALMVLMNQGMERFTLGVPKLHVPATVKPGSKEWDAARQVCIDYVSRPRMGVVEPEGYVFETVKINSAMPEIIPYMEYHDAAIARALGVEFSSLGSKEGSNVPVAAQMSMTAQSVSAMLKDFCSVVNLYVIPKIVMVNWPDKTTFPRLIAEPITQDDLSAAANLFGMLLNGAIDIVVAEKQAEVQKEAAAQAAQAAKTKASTTPGASKAKSTPGKKPAKKFGELDEDEDEDDTELDFADAVAKGAQKLAATGGSPSELGAQVQATMQALIATLPTKLKRLTGHLADEQAAQIGSLRTSAQTVRTVDGRKPVP